MITWVGLLALVTVVGNQTDRTFIQFGSRVCPPCQLIQPVMDQLRTEGWTIRYIDAETDRLSVQRFGVRQTPTVIVMERGREIDRIVGMLPDKELRRRLTGSDAPLVKSSPVAPPSEAPQRVAPPRSRSLPQKNAASDAAEERSRLAQGSASANRYSTLGPNHPLNRSTASATSVPIAIRRSLFVETAGDVKQAIIGINHPLYSHYHRPPANPFDALRRQDEAEIRDPLPTAPVGMHPLLEGLVPLPDSPQSMSATVRIQVVKEESKSVGTGTIIHTAGEHALVLTCAHLFLDRKVDSVITVELFREGKVVREQATVVDIRQDSIDLALIRFRSSTPLAKVPVLPKGEQLQEHDQVFSIGCDSGADPSRRESVVSKLNRYLGSSNVEAAGAPVQGRSGGGLFDAHGRLVGVCYAADHVLDEGIYVGPEAIHAQLEKLRLNWLIEEKNVSKNLASKNSVSRAK